MAGHHSMRITSLPLKMIREGKKTIELPLLECGYTEEDIDNASPDDMEEYYPKEKQARYGVVGIKVSLI